MPQLKYTSSLRDQSGETNSATPLTDNLQKVEDLATIGFGYENIEDWSLDQSHVYDGGGTPVPLKDTQCDFVAGPTVYSLLNGTFEDAATVTVTCESGVSGIYVYGGLFTSSGAFADTFEIRLDLDGGAIAGTVRDIGAASSTNGGGQTMHAFRATAGTHTLKLQTAVTTAVGGSNWRRAFITVFVISR